MALEVALQFLAARLHGVPCWTACSQCSIWDLKSTCVLPGVALRHHAGAVVLVVPPVAVVLGGAIARDKAAAHAAPVAQLAFIVGGVSICPAPLACTSWHVPRLAKEFWAVAIQYQRLMECLDWHGNCCRRLLRGSRINCAVMAPSGAGSCGFFSEAPSIRSSYHSPS